MNKAELKKNLRTVIGQEKLAEGVELIQVIKDLDEFTQEESDNLSSKLKHYLQKRSYGKALSYLEGEENDGEED